MTLNRNIIKEDGAFIKMEINAASLLSWVIWLFICATVSSDGDFFIDPPSISPDANYVNLGIGTNFTLTCASVHQITWKPFKGFTGTYEIKHVETGEKERRYQSTIHLVNISHLYVGYFFCVANRTQSVYDYSINFLVEHRLESEISGLSAIYLYVNDAQHLLVNNHQEISIFENEYLIVPCKPTSYNVRTMLLENGNEVDWVTYDKTIGYLIKSTKVPNIIGRIFMCSSTPLIDSNGSNQSFAVRYRDPNVQSTTGLYVTEGEQLSLNCSVSILKDEKIAMVWKLPKEKTHRVVATKTVEYPNRSDLQIQVGVIDIRNIDIDKDGGYECEVMDNLKIRRSDGVSIKIFEKNNNSIDIDTPNGVYKMEVSTERLTAVWRVRYGGRSKPISLQWFDNFNRIIKESDKYEMKVTNDYTILKINYLAITDSGNYTLKASNSLDSRLKKFELIVNEVPRLATVSGPQFVQKGETAKFVCSCTGYPLSTITWTFRRCAAKPKWPNCGTRQRIEEQFINTTSMAISNQRSVLKLNTTEAGIVECVAVNTQGKAASDAIFKITYMEKPFVIRGLTDNKEIAGGENVTVTCEASAYTYLDVQWYLNSSRILSKDDRKVERCDEDYSHCEKITWTRIRPISSGRYECRTNYYDEESLPKTEYLNVKVLEPKKPEISSSSIESNELGLGASFRLYCYFTGLPFPEIEWYKNGVLIENDTRITISADKQTLDITDSTKDDYGNFTCYGENRIGSAERTMQLKSVTSINAAWIIPVIALILIFTFSTVYFIFRFRRLRRELNAAGLANFEEGDLDSINPDLALHEQADLLPYNRKFEFPKEKLKLGKILGAGAFGVVAKGIATGLMAHEEKTTVAVKMLKKTAGNEGGIGALSFVIWIMLQAKGRRPEKLYQIKNDDHLPSEIKALVTELKIMIHLGKHLNVVNMLAAVTKNITKREAMVIVEYCRFGNVQNFLIQHREYFIDQISNGSIDPKILSKEQNCSQNTSDATVPTYQNLPMHTAVTYTTLVSSNSSSTGENVVLSNNSVQSASESDYMRHITTTDLVSWLFQVARGMRYLTSRKVLHGDLAARNILLGDDNVVKICDFGLARSLYKCNNYKKEGEALLPFKWLAIESIRDRVFSSLSDCWSFGIVMWELFSLGATPYPGMDANQDLFCKLIDGYRMDKPENATHEIYDIMLHCWNFNPESRPSFDALEEIFRKLLDKKVTQHYVDLNQPYVEMNANNFNQGQTDYLSFLGPPLGVAPSTLDTESDRLETSKGAVPAYLPMKPIQNSYVKTTGDISGGVSNVVSAEPNVNAMQNEDYFCDNPTYFDLQSLSKNWKK